MAADDLATQGDKASKAMIFTFQLAPLVDYGI